VRLVELERYVLDAPRLGWYRDDDLSSALIPQFYFDYLRGGAAQPLAGVVKHNQMDLRGLAALFGKINSLLASREALDENDSRDLFGLSKFLQRRGENDRARSVCAKALDSGLPAEYRARATRDLATMAKHLGDKETAADLWLELVADPRDGVTACEQLAIHHERISRDFQRAFEYANLALAKVRSQSADSRYASSRARVIEKKLMCRLERLRHRIGKAKVTAHAPLLAHSPVAGPRQRSR
jgi:hypothetical protein